MVEFAFQLGTALVAEIALMETASMAETALTEIASLAGIALTETALAEIALKIES